MSWRDLGVAPLVGAARARRRRGRRRRARRDRDRRGSRTSGSSGSCRYSKTARPAGRRAPRANVLLERPCRRRPGKRPKSGGRAGPPRGAQHAPRPAAFSVGERPVAVEVVDGVGDAGQRVGLTRPGPSSSGRTLARSRPLRRSPRVGGDDGTDAVRHRRSARPRTTTRRSQFPTRFRQSRREARSTILSTARAGRQRAEDRAPVPAQARGAERVGDRRRRVPQQQRALQAQGQQAGDPARPERQLRRGRRARRAAASPRRRTGCRRPRASSISAVTAASVSEDRPIARRTSRAMTLPEPSQIEFSGACR